MPADSPIPPVGDSFMTWRQKYPKAADDLIRIVNLIYALQLDIVVPSSDNRARTAILASPEKIILNVPLKLGAPIANSTAAAASVSTQLNALLAALRVTGQLPS